MENQESPRRPPKVKFLIYIFVGLVLVIVAYQGVRWSIRSTTDEIIQGMVGKKLPNFRLRAVRGNRHYSHDAFYDRSVVLHFFGSNCDDVFEEKDRIRRFVGSIDPERSVLFSACVDEPRRITLPVTEKTLVRLGYNHIIVRADDDFMDAFHGLSWAHITPVIYVINPDGIITDAFRHPYDLKDVRDALRAH